MKLIVKAGKTSQTLNVFIADSSSTTGAGLTGLAYNTASLTAYYCRPQAAAASITLATLAAVNSAWSSGGFKEIDSTNMPGWYRFDVPDAVIAAGVDSVAIHLKGAANMAPLPIEINLVAYDPQDTVRLGLTALPNVASGNAGAIITSGTGTAQLSVSGGVAQADAAKVGGQTASASGTVTFPNATLASTTNITAGTITTATNLTNAPTSGDFTAAMKASILTTALTESYATSGAAPTLTQFLYQLWQFVSQGGISGTTKTTKKLDNSTTAMVHTTDSATQPTSISRTS